MRKIGILGGAFDPIHLGHLMMAENAADAFGLDKVIFTVAFQSPFKGKAASPKHRLNMVKAAIKGNKRFEVSDVELKRKGVSYTIDTVGYFKHHHPNDELFLIIGQDNVSGLKNWKNIDVLKKMAHFVVIERDWFNVSSSLIRTKLKTKKSVRYLTPDAVIGYISRHNLYGK
jgi:nicotinate-nucleotide adenylyltransferase